MSTHRRRFRRAATLALASLVSGCGAGVMPGTFGDGGAGDADARTIDGGTTTGGTGLPCAVDELMRQRCQSCHGATPISGVPMPMVTYEDLVAPSGVDPTVTVAARALVRMRDTVSIMPPAGMLAAAEINAFEQWVTAGTPRETCATAPDGGVDAGAPDPLLDAPPTCTSGVLWTRGNHGSGSMNPGQACIACHDVNDGPSDTLAGTVYPSGHEPNNCNGARGAGAIVVEITDATGAVLRLQPNSVGNFYARARFATPYTARVLYEGRARQMATPQTSGDCNSCHTQEGAMSAPGRITLP